MPIDKKAVLARLDKRSFFKTHIPSLKENNGAEAKGLCPFHDDHTPSLSVNLEKGLYRCFSCSASGDVFKFYQELKGVNFKTALEEVGRFAGVNGGPGPVVARYKYTDIEGKELYIKERREPGKDGKSKDFVFKPYKRGGNDPVPYNLPILAKVKYTFIVEGEGKVEALGEWGFVATCLDTGFQSPWRDHYLPHFEGKEKVVILPDNDGPGREYAEKIAKALHGHVGEIKVVELPGLPEKGDVIDWKEAGGTKEQLQKLIQVAPVWNPPAETENKKEEAGVNSHPDTWPVLEPEALYGLAGDVVRAIEPHSEADPAALLVNLLVGFGNAVGGSPHFMAEADRHPVKLFAVFVGETSKARKGSSWGHIERLLEAVDPDWAGNRILSGLSSGEGLIWSVRDPIEKTEVLRNGQSITGHRQVVVDAGVDDKRVLFFEAEFASVLRTLGRDGNTLSAVIRQAWDKGHLCSVTKNSPAKATGTHISILGHITKNELLRYLDSTEASNGFGNRFLWFCVRRSKTLPEGGGFVNLEPLTNRLTKALTFARATGEIRRDETARDMWCDIYDSLSEGKPGMFGSLTARAEAQVMRLACLYALLDQSSAVKVVHLLAALSLWDHCEASVKHIFGSSTGDYVVDRIQEALEQAPDDLSRTEVSDLFGRNLNAARVDRAVRSLISRGVVEPYKKSPSGAGRPTEFLRLTMVRN